MRSGLRVDPEAAPAGRICERVFLFEEEVDCVERDGARRRAAGGLLDRQVRGEQPIRQPGGSGGHFVAFVADRAVHGMRRGFGLSAYENRQPA